MGHRSLFRFSHRELAWRRTRRLATGTRLGVCLSWLSAFGYLGAISAGHLICVHSSQRSPVSSLTFLPLITYELPNDWYLASNEATWTWNFRHNTSTSIPISAGVGKIFRFSDEAAIKTQLSGEWMLYRQFDPQEEQFTLKFELTLLLPKLEA